MNKKYLLLVGLLPLFYSCANQANVNKVDVLSTPTITNEEQEEPEACTIMYVGKDLTKDKRAIIARSADAGPGAMCINTTIFNHNQLANQTVTSHKGFTYKMPSTTYRYISTPRNPVMNKGHHWEASAVNENGVGVSATLSCVNNAIANSVDPLVPTGIGEDNIAEIVAATASTAKEGIETIAHIIDTQGSCETNAIMTIDANEAWYMEIYTGHEYAAVKMPNDKILTAGNEFVLDSLESMNINISDTILSEHLLDCLPASQRVPENCDDVTKLDLFHTYAQELIGEPATVEELPYEDELEKARISSANSHRRTWRGYNLFSRDKYPEYKKYAGYLKYPAFYDIDDGTLLDVHDVTKYMRDRFENILEADGNPNTPFFEFDRKNGNLRYIGFESAYQVHAIEIDKTLPKNISATMWLSLCNPNYTPFIPINAGVNSMSNYFTHVSNAYEYDPESAAHIFKHLNSLGFTRRKEYGLPIEEFWKQHELIWEKEYKEILNKTSDLNINVRRDILTNYVTTTQNEAIKAAKFMINDLTWHMMSDQSSLRKEFTLFTPCVNVKDFAHSYGYSYAFNNQAIMLKKGTELYNIKVTNTEYRPGDSRNYRYLAEISDGSKTKEIQIGIDGNDYYIPYKTLSEYVKGDLVVNIGEYITPSNNIMYWLIPTVIAVPIIGGLTYYFVSKKRKKGDNVSRFKY